VKFELEVDMFQQKDKSERASRAGVNTICILSYINFVCTHCSTLLKLLIVVDTP
jgi:hypothetical protein